MWFQKVGLLFPVLYLIRILVRILLLFEQVRVRVDVFLFFRFFGFVQQEKTSIWYHMICGVVFVVFWGTLLRLTAGAVVLIRKFYHPAKRCLAMCEHTERVLVGFVLVFTATSAVNTA